MKHHQTNSFISRAAAMLLTVIMAFAGAQTAGAQNTCYVTFDISGKGTVEFDGASVTNGKPIDCLILPGKYLTITPETGYYVSSVTYDATDGLIIFLNQNDAFQWSLNIHQYKVYDTPTITVHIVFDKAALAGGADEASAVALTADDDLSRLAGGWYKVESDLTIDHTVNLHGDTHITIASGATLTVSTSDEYGIYGSALTVSGEGTLAVSASNSVSKSAIYVDNYTQTGCAVTLSGNNFGLNAKNNVSISGGSLTTSGATYGISTDNEAITISGGTVSASGDQCGLYAGDAVSITGGTVNASGNVGNGIRGYSVSITGGQVTASSGGIWSRVGDITLGWTSATDYITASGFTVEEGQHVKIADGQTLYGGFPSASFTGTIGDPSALNGLMLRTTAAVTESGTNEYTIWNADGWDAFCDRLAADDGKDFFSGKTVRLGADITVSRMASADYHDFCGTFDGGGHTLTFTATATDNYLAPFRNVLGNSDTDHAVIKDLNVVTNITAADYRHAGGLIAEVWGYVDVVNCNVTVNITATAGSTQTELYPAGLVSQVVKGAQLTVSGCTVGGTIATDGKYAAGLVGIVQGSANIVNSVSSVTINSSTAGDGTHGGLVAVSYPGSTNIEGCLFNGRLLGESTNCCGGFVGWRNTGTVSISNSFFAPAEVNIGVGTGDYPSATFVRNGVSNITNCYYTEPFGSPQGKQARTVTAGDGVTIGHDGVATEYSVSGITAYKASGASGDSDPFIAGIIYNNVLYAGSGEDVSLTLSNTATGAPQGYRYAGYTASAGTLSGTTLTMPDENVTISVNTDVLTVLPWSGDGTEGSPYIIKYASQLDLLAHRVNGTHGETAVEDGYYNTYFQLAKDITYNHTTDWDDAECEQESNYEAIGCYYGGGYRYFSGHFNGNSKTISGIRIYKGGNDDADRCQGIFGQTYGADIHDLTLADARITGYTYTGGIVGYKESSTVTRCHVAADVAVCAVQSDAWYHGGISGNNRGGTIEQCTSAATLTTADANNSKYYGGIAGINDKGTLRDNLAIGATVPAAANNSYGAITGNNNSRVKHNYYAACKVANTPNATGVGCGYIDDGNGGRIVADVNNNNKPNGAVPALRDDADNSTAIGLFAALASTANGHTPVDLGWGAGKYPMQLAGRTLYKDGSWNTLCLPFALSAEQIAAHTDFSGATLMELDTDGKNGFDPTNGTLWLTFKSATAIAAGVPYLVKWAKAADYDSDPSAYDFTSPTFSGVTINATASTTVSDADGDLQEVQMVGCFSPVPVEANDKSILYLGDANTLYYSSIDRDIRSCRAYFSVPYIKQHAQAQARAFHLDFGGDEPTGIISIHNSQCTIHNEAGAWYTLDGRKLQAQPTKSGLYIHGGRKVVIK